MATYEEGRLAALAVRLALSTGLPSASARAALELASRMMDDLEPTAAVKKGQSGASSMPVRQPNDTRNRKGFGAKSL